MLLLFPLYPRAFCQDLVEISDCVKEEEEVNDEASLFSTTHTHATAASGLLRSSHADVVETEIGPGQKHASKQQCTAKPPLL